MILKSQKSRSKNGCTKQNLDSLKRNQQEKTKFNKWISSELNGNYNQNGWRYIYSSCVIVQN